MGGLVATAYALGAPLERIEKVALRFTTRDIADLTLPRASFLKGRKLAKIIDKLTERKSFADCRIPVAITATNIKSGEELIFTCGNLQKILRASCSWPGFFPPVEVDGKLLSDGGIRNSVPAKWAKKLGATFVIAVRVGFSPQKIETDNIFQLMLQSIQIMGEELDKYQSKHANVTIVPDLTHHNQLDFDKAREIILSGEIAAEKSVKRIKYLMPLFRI